MEHFGNVNANSEALFMVKFHLNRQLKLGR